MKDALVMKLTKLCINVKEVVNESHKIEHTILRVLLKKSVQEKILLIIEIFHICVSFVIIQ